MSLRSNLSLLSLALLGATFLAPAAEGRANAPATSVVPANVTTAAATSGTPSAASAVPALVGFFAYGDAVFETGPLPKAWVDKHPALRSQLADKRAGYKCKVLTLFWAVIWRSDCTAVAFSGEKYLSEDRLPTGAQNWITDLNQAIAAQYKPTDIKMSFWTRHGRWILGGILLLFLFGQVVRRRNRG